MRNELRYRVKSDSKTKTAGDSNEQSVFDNAYSGKFHLGGDEYVRGIDAVVERL